MINTLVYQEVQITCYLPLFEIAAESIKSTNYHEYYRKVFELSFYYLKSKFEDNRK